jgi:hypothetical protein
VVSYRCANRPDDRPVTRRPVAGRPRRRGQVSHVGRFAASLNTLLGGIPNSGTPKRPTTRALTKTQAGEPAPAPRASARLRRYRVRVLLRTPATHHPRVWRRCGTVRSFCVHRRAARSKREWRRLAATTVVKSAAPPIHRPACRGRTNDLFSVGGAVLGSVLGHSGWLAAARKAHRRSRRPGHSGWFAIGHHEANKQSDISG